LEESNSKDKEVIAEGMVESKKRKLEGLDMFKYK
jgi:hypothetical protein